VGRQRLQRGAAAPAPGVRRPRSHRARVHPGLLDAPHHHDDDGHDVGRRPARRRGRGRVRPRRGLRGRAGARPPPRRRVPVLPEQPHRDGALPRHRRRRARRGPRRAHRRRRGLRGVRPTGHPECPDPARGPTAARRDAHDEQGVRPGRWPSRVPRRRPGPRRRAAPGADAVPPRHPDPGGGPRRARARRPHARDGGRDQGQRDRLVAELTAMGLDPVPSDANFVLFGGLEDSRRRGRRCSSGASSFATSASPTIFVSRPAPRRRPPPSCRRCPTSHRRTAPPARP
jgi:hypothetical protein